MQQNFFFYGWVKDWHLYIFKIYYRIFFIEPPHLSRLLRRFNNRINYSKIVETMSYTDNVASFLVSLDSFYENVPAEDLELLVGPVLERIRSQPGSPLSSSPLGQSIISVASSSTLSLTHIKEASLLFLTLNYPQGKNTEIICLMPICRFHLDFLLLMFLLVCSRLQRDFASPCKKQHVAPHNKQSRNESREQSQCESASTGYRRRG